jgi:anaerobic selenocysteine-containing dehydrogenase
MVNKVSDTLPFGDALIRIAQSIGGDVARALPWGTSKDTTRELVRPLYNRKSGSIVADDFESFWNGFLQRGGWWSANNTGANSGRATSFPSSPEQPKFAGDEKDGFTYYLNVFDHNTLSTGARTNARLPWLQAAPDPITTAVWGTWVELNYKVAKQLGVQNNDVVRVESPNGWIEAPVYLNPGTPDWTVAIPAGNGHSMKIWADLNGTTGVNPLSIIAPQVEVQSGGTAWAATRVKLTKTGSTYKQQKLEGYVVPVQKEDGTLIEITNS